MKAFAATLGALIVTAGLGVAQLSPAAVHRYRTQVGTGADTAPVSATVAMYIRRLQTTLESELYARDYYAAAYIALGLQRFNNLTGAEQNHANAVAGMIQYLGGVPVMAHNYTVVPPTTIDEADGVCIQIELHVIDVYAGLIADCPDPALLPILNNIQASNLSHLNSVGG
ncbi:MAG: ferritin-like domain-containing protein [Planctomycetota bacterium]